MGWLYMLVSAAAVVVLFGAKPQTAFYAALAVFAASFWTFCLLYDEPLNRARRRVAGQLAQLSGKGLHAEEFSRLQSTVVRPTLNDRKFQLTFVSGVNAATGAAGLALLIWGILIRAL